MYAFVNGEVPRFVLKSVRNGWRSRLESEGCLEEDFECARDSSARPICLQKTWTLAGPSWRRSRAKGLEKDRKPFQTRWRIYLGEHGDRIGRRDKSRGIHTNGTKNGGRDVFFIRHTSDFGEYEAKELEGNIRVCRFGVRSEKRFQVFDGRDQVCGD